MKHLLAALVCVTAVVAIVADDSMTVTEPIFRDGDAKFMEPIFASDDAIIIISDQPVGPGTTQPDAELKVEKEFKLSRYLVIYRTSSPQIIFDGDTATYTPQSVSSDARSWQYHEEFANTHEDLIWLLEHRFRNPDNLVGIWDISNSPQIQAESWMEEVVIPEKVVERRYTERRWKLIPHTETEK